METTFKKTMKFIKHILFALPLFLNFKTQAQTVTATPHNQSICFGASATFSATYTGPAATSTTNYTISTIPYAPDPLTAGTAVTLSDDSQTGFLPIGFTFCYFGNSYTQFIIGSNNWIGFSAGQTSTWVTVPIPTNAGTAPMNTIMGAWQDINPGAGGTVKYAVYGTAPFRRLSVSWYNVPMFSCTGQLYSSQIIIYETTNIIETHILNKSLCTGWNSGNAVHGLHDPTGTVAIVVPGRNNTQWTATNEGRRFTPSGPATNVINWYIIPGNTLVGTGNSITVTPPACQVTTSYYAQASTAGTCVTALARDTVTVTQTNCSPCSLTAGSNGPICVGSALNLTASAVAGATYSWTGPNGFTSTLQNPTIASATAAAAGTYTVIATQAASCSSCTTTVNVIVNPIPAAPTAGSNTPVCSGNTLNLTTPAVAGAVYNWTGPGAFTSTNQNPSIPSVTTAASGTYSVTVTVNGCTSPAGTTPVVINNTPAAPIPNSNSPICEGTNLALTANNIAGATYAWTGPAGFTASVRNPPPFAATVANAGTYSLTVTVGGCTSPVATVNVVINAVPVAPTVSNVTICSGTSATLTATAPGPVYEWYDAATGGTLLTTGVSYTTPVLTSSTTYYVQAVNGTCIGPRTAVTVTVQPSISVTTSANTSICEGSSTTLNVISPTGAGYTYSWDAPSSTGFSSVQNPSVSPTATTTYTVTVADAFGCSGTGNVTITVSPAMTLTLTPTDVTCSGLCNGAVASTFTGGIAPYNYAWSNGNTTPNLGSVCANTYTLVVTDAIGCTISQTATVNAPAGLSATNGQTNVTCNGLCNGTAFVTPVGGTMPYTYLWNNGQTSATAVSLCAGVNSCTITDANGCTATSTVTITQPAVLAIAPVAGATVCEGQSATLSATVSGGTAPVTISWASPAGTGANYTATPTTTTTYTVNATDANGCTAAAQTATIIVRPALSVIASNNVSICVGASTTLTASASGGNASYTYTWMPGSLTGTSVTVSPASTTTYTVTVTDGCSLTPATATVTVTILPKPTVNFTSNINSGCTPLCVNFTDNSSTTGGTITTWSWSFGNGGASTQNPTNCFDNQGQYNVSLTVTDNNGCTNTATINNMINAIAVPTAAFVASPQPASISNPNITFNDVSSYATSWNWNFGDTYNVGAGNTSTQQSPTYTYSMDGNYCITLVVSNQNTCFDSVTHCIDIQPDYTLYIPNAFTPDGNSLNATFTAKGSNIAEFTMYIFNRWGNLIYQTNDIYKGWDGTYKNQGNPAEQGVYVYRIVTKDKVGQVREYVGHVTLVK